MTAGLLPAGCLCLLSGALLGGLFLAFKLLRLLIRGGKLCTALFDILFCLICAVTAFFCALALDKGRLRLFQVVMQGVGAWGVIVSLDPLVNGGVACLRRAGRWLRGFLRRRILRPAWNLLGRLRRRAGEMWRKIFPRKEVPVKKARRKGAKRRGRRRPGGSRHNKQKNYADLGTSHKTAAATQQSRK